MEYIAHHEIKHVKTIDIGWEDPQFRKKWESYSRDDQGRLLYSANWKSVCRNIPVIARVASFGGYGREFERHGFVNEYAGTCFEEDVTELCTTAEIMPELFVQWLVLKPNKRIIGKVALAQEYGLIPRDFTDRINEMSLHYRPTQEFLERVIENE